MHRPGPRRGPRRPAGSSVGATGAQGVLRCPLVAMTFITANVLGLDRGGGPGGAPGPCPQPWGVKPCRMLLGHFQKPNSLRVSMCAALYLHLWLFFPSTNERPTGLFPTPSRHSWLLKDKDATWSWRGAATPRDSQGRPPHGFLLKHGCMSCVGPMGVRFALVPGYTPSESFPMWVSSPEAMWRGTGQCQGQGSRRSHPPGILSRPGIRNTC